MIKVFLLMRCVDGVLVFDEDSRGKGDFRPGDAVGVLTNLQPPAESPGPAWMIEITLSERPGAQCITFPLEPFLTEAEYAASCAVPLCLADVETVQLYLQRPHKKAVQPPRWLWLFRDGLYVTERFPRPSETEEVVLRIKAHFFQRDEGLKRLREQVANFEAIERNLKRGVSRQPIPDDVKLLVWTRDGGACVRCGATSDLHFDHVIPLSRGGSDEAENIQLLCRACNLSKGSRIA